MPGGSEKSLLPGIAVTEIPESGSGRRHAACPYAPKSCRAPRWRFHAAAAINGSLGRWEQTQKMYCAERVTGSTAEERDWFLALKGASQKSSLPGMVVTEILESRSLGRHARPCFHGKAASLSLVSGIQRRLPSRQMVRLNGASEKNLLPGACD
jgi:hypothetical protein